jgi:hypothetical protein
MRRPPAVTAEAQAEPAEQDRAGNLPPAAVEAANPGDLDGQRERKPSDRENLAAAGVAGVLLNVAVHVDVRS